MKLVIAAAAATMLGITFGVPQNAFAQDAAEAAGTPALRDDSADAAEAPVAGAEDPAAEGADAAAASSAPVDPAAALADATAAAAAAGAEPGAVDDPLVSKVVDYVLFQRDLNAIEARAISEPEDLDAIMDTFAGYDAGTLTGAFYSYGAFIAAQNQAFVDKVKEVAEYYGVDQLVTGMINEPEYVLSFEGARAAADIVTATMREDTERLVQLSNRFKQESYDLQNRGWSNLIAKDRRERLARLDAPRRVTTPSQDMLSNVAYGAPITSADAAAGARRAAFWSTVDYRDDPALTPEAVTDRHAEAIGVMMTLAALRTLDVSQTRPDLVAHLLSLPSAKDCLDFSLLILEQCVAAAHFKYEDAFCIAEHQLLDAGQCLGETVNGRPVALPPRAPEVTQAAAEATTETAATAMAAEATP